MTELTPIFFEQEVVSTEVIRYVEQFNQFSRTTSDAIISMGRVVFEAKQKLPKDHFAQFCREIRYDSDSSAIRKLGQIGEKADLLARHSEKLPSTWTTIYTLTQLGNEVLESKLESGEIHSAIAGSEATKIVSQHLPKPTKPRTTKPTSTAAKFDVEDERYEFTLRFDSVPSQAVLREFETQILALIGQQEIECRLVRNDAITNYLE